MPKITSSFAGDIHLCLMYAPRLGEEFLPHKRKNLLKEICLYWILLDMLEV